MGGAKGTPKGATKSPGDPEAAAAVLSLVCAAEVCTRAIPIEIVAIREKTKRL